ncbi:MAG: amidohydrolase family protein [Deltaproteobacteria bacterium]|nr:amidohydrolase family protein [Deltaproteobacteria bacterium]
MMIIDTHVHVLSYPSLQDLSEKITTTEDLITFRTRYPRLYKATLSESPVDNSQYLISDMDKHGVSCALVQARPGSVTNEQVADVVKKYPDRLAGLFRIGHDQEAAGYLDDPKPVRETAPEEIKFCIEKLHMKGMGEVFVRAFTTEIHPEKIAKDLDPIMNTLGKYKVPVQFPTAWSQFPGGLYYGNPIFVDEIAQRHPDVPIILTKMGRGIGYYFDTSMAVALRNTNIFFDTVGTIGSHLRIAVDKIGAERVMFGTDWSATWRWISKPADLYTIRLKTLDDAGLSDREREQVLWKTAVQVFKLETEEHSFVKRMD